MSLGLSSNAGSPDCLEHQRDHPAVTPGPAGPVTALFGSAALSWDIW